MAYLTAAQLRNRVDPLQDASKFPDVMLTDLVAEFEQIAEKYLGVAFLPRTETETLLVNPAGRQSGFWPNGARLRLKWPQVRSITSVTNGLDLIAADQYSYDAYLGGLYYGGAIPAIGLVVVYQHGFTTPTPVILRACREYVRSCALQDRSSIPRDVIGQSYEGTYTRYSTPDWDAGRPTGWLEVDRLLESETSYRTPSLA